MLYRRHPCLERDGEVKEMTWGEFKKVVEEHGVEDNSELVYIDWESGDWGSGDDEPLPVQVGWIERDDCRLAKIT